MNELLQSDIASADPAAGYDDDHELHGMLHAMARRVRASAPAPPQNQAPWWKRRRSVVTLTIIGAVALTGAAALVPFSLAVNGTQVTLDAEIPIVYTTDNGIDVSCRYGIYFGVPEGRTAADEALVAFVQQHDWSGVGQRVYDQAIANPFVPGPNDDWEVDTQELRDYTSFHNALGVVTWDEIPADLRQGTISSGGTSDCTGRLR